MNRKQIVLSLIAVLVALSAVGVASAQDLEHRPDEGRGRDRHPAMKIMRHVMSTVSEATGLEPRDVMTQLADGSTLSEIVTANGGDVDAVKAEILAPMQERIATALENERITQEQADELLTRATERLDEMFDRVFERLGERPLPGERRGPRGRNEV